MGLLLIEKLPLGFNDMMEGFFPDSVYRVRIYAVANTIIMLMLLYFTDYRGALIASASFLLRWPPLGTVLSLFLIRCFTVSGLRAGGIAFFLVSWLRLRRFTRKLPIYEYPADLAEVRYGAFSKSRIIWEKGVELI